MSGPDPDDVARLFDLACELPEAQRSGFLEKACADDPALRDEVASLLEHDRDLPDVLQTAGMPVHRAVRADPEWIGPFHVLERLAEGGMGIVYRG